MENNCFTHVRPWMEQILQSVKKDIKTDHLPGDKSFYKAHFGSRSQNKLTQEEIFAVYEKELLAGNQELMDWVVNRWVFKHGDVYRHFAERLGRINPHFQEIQSLSDQQAEQVLAGAIDAYGATATYLFARLNAVVFPDAVFEKLHREALAETRSKEQMQEQKQEKESQEQLATRHQREMARLQEKYEDRLAGVQRKYIMDTEALKKQIRALQQQMNVSKTP
jgi:hypothetical protein